MKVFQGLKNIPEGNKVIGQYKADKFYDLPEKMREPVMEYFKSIHFTPRVDQCTFYLTDGNDVVIGGIEEQEIDMYLKIAYSCYLCKFKKDNEHELFNGSCHASKSEFIEDCKADPQYIKYFLAKKEYQSYLQLTSDSKAVFAGV